MARYKHLDKTKNPLQRLKVTKTHDSATNKIILFYELEPIVKLRKEYFDLGEPLAPAATSTKHSKPSSHSKEPKPNDSNTSTNSTLPDLPDL